MIPKTHRQEIIQPNGDVITLETGKLAKQADGSVVVTLKHCTLLATVVSSKEQSDVDFLPLTVDYREKFAAAGRFPGGFFKREARPSTEEILTMRLVDRMLRPLFPWDYHAETQVMIQLMSHDDEVIPDFLAGLAASTAIALSDIPFADRVSEVRVGRIDGQYVLNPSKSQLADSDIDIIVGASQDSVMMVEGEFKEISEAEMIGAIDFGHQAIKTHIEAQNALVKKVGEKPTREYERFEEDKDLESDINQSLYDKYYKIASKGYTKKERSEFFELAKEDYLSKFDPEEIEEKTKQFSHYLKEVKKKAVRDLMLKKGKRLDGRKSTDIRDIWCEVDYLYGTHGSAIFSRGETQALATTTLGTSREANVIDIPTLQSEEKFYLHYNFPPFSTGEARPIRGTSRREVGHGNLAQRALKNLIPQECPYTIRVVSDILESNGSSSMATVCASSMALMDAGIQIDKTVSGIAMGLVSNNDDFIVLSDIIGDEDHLGDMDFKVTGTANGITACQMDIKIEGLSFEVLQQALEQARIGRLHILKLMNQVIDKPRENIKPHAPKIIKITVPADFIGAIIGPSGKVIQEIQKETETTIVIEEVDEQGIVEILGVNQEKIDLAIKKIENIIFVPKQGEVYTVKVIKIVDFGAVVEFVPGNEVLLHISELKWGKVHDVHSVLEIGQEVDVKYLGIDSRTKKMKVSRRVLLPKPEGYQPHKPHQRSNSNSSKFSHQNKRPNKNFRKFRKPSKSES
ncbi:MAG: polyribonucleotide nucleotidyltransferase [Flavobacteriaceae bacterium]|nr:polyribonucleotide nucleotidyltransferase [Flavobacteriaceae bacterium]MCY4253322.1 polyribonucleotide nucleotidyltransferase [Flavobacteriaceae bacterium]